MHFRTVAGTAKPGIDYEHQEGLLEFPAGSTSAAIEVVVMQDPAAIERDESFTVELFEPTPSQAKLTTAKVSTIASYQLIFLASATSVCAQSASPVHSRHAYICRIAVQHEQSAGAVCSSNHSNKCTGCGVACGHGRRRVRAVPPSSAQRRAHCAAADAERRAAARQCRRFHCAISHPRRQRRGRRAHHLHVTTLRRVAFWTGVRATTA